MAGKWVSDEVRKLAEPDEYGRVYPFAICVYYPETGRELVTRNLSLAFAEERADREAADGRRVSVFIDTCG